MDQPDTPPDGPPETPQAPLGYTPCKAHSKQTGKPCRQRPVPGLDVCYYHGGATPTSKAKSARFKADQQALVIFRTLGYDREVTPSEALLEEVQRTAGHVAWLRGMVEQLEPDALVAGVVRQETKDTVVMEVGSGGMRILPGVERKTTQAAAPSVWYELYMREREHLVKVCAAAASAGIETRRIELAESQGQLVAGAIEVILAGLLAGLLKAGLDPRAIWSGLIREVVPTALRSIT